MTLTDKLKKLLANHMVDCETHEDCDSCPLSNYIKITMPVGDVEAIKENGAWSGNMPFGKVGFQIQPCMMFSEIIRQLPLDNKPDELDELTVKIYYPSDSPFTVFITNVDPNPEGKVKLVYEY